MACGQGLLGRARYAGTAAAIGLLLASPAVAGQMETLVMGGTFEYVLEGTPGTGAEWSFDADESENAHIVEVEAIGYGEPDSELIGGPAPFTFRLTPLEPGSARLVFNYGRSWESEPFRTHELRVQVRAQ